MTKIFAIAANGTPMGSFEGEAPEDAILGYVESAGYRDIAHMAVVLGKTEDEIVDALEVAEAKAA
ncbi:hypothetical protein CN128_07485 [Sinorhizobium meliloti]|uniref:hypothetical protein n=1 Tax=Rhizobium meliloti TaxID=382 RepID=UPI000FD80159|nr:hypothetical protein [Sinorhizobium meliloti]RVM58882.1 hypothetical protein CN128_07485 [Sinorhizobium meliloti]